MIQAKSLDQSFSVNNIAAAAGGLTSDVSAAFGVVLFCFVFWSSSSSGSVLQQRRGVGSATRIGFYTWIWDLVTRLAFLARLLYIF